MIFIECSWCETEVALDGLDAMSVDCPVCLTSVEFASDPEELAAAA
jgi:hypothetical protein